MSAERPVIEVARYVVGEAVWAPSVHNTQPWWFSVGPSGLGLYADPARQLTVADPAGREMLISCGAALFTARLALRAAGYIPETQILPDRCSLPCSTGVVARPPPRTNAACTARCGSGAPIGEALPRCQWPRNCLRCYRKPPAGTARY